MARAACGAAQNRAWGARAAQVLESEVEERAAKVPKFSRHARREVFLHGTAPWLILLVHLPTYLGRWYAT